MKNSHLFTCRKYNDSRPPRLCEQQSQNSTVRKRNATVSVFQRSVETSWNGKFLAKYTDYVESVLAIVYSIASN